MAWLLPPLSRLLQRSLIADPQPAQVSSQDLGYASANGQPISVSGEAERAPVKLDIQVSAEPFFVGALRRQLQRFQIVEECCAVEQGPQRTFPLGSASQLQQGPAPNLGTHSYLGFGQGLFGFGARLWPSASMSALHAGIDDNTSQPSSACSEGSSTFVERLKQMTPDDEWHTAIHEAGHAVVAWYLHPAFSVSKVTIIPNWEAQSLGRVRVRSGPRMFVEHQVLLDWICFWLAGVTAEQVILGKDTGGGGDDIRQIIAAFYVLFTTGVLYKLLWAPMACLSLLSGDPFFLRFLEWLVRPSEDDLAVIIEQAEALLEVEKQRARELIKLHRDKIEALAHELMRKKELTADEVADILGERRPAVPWAILPTGSEYFVLCGTATGWASAWQASAWLPVEEKLRQQLASSRTRPMSIALYLLALVSHYSMDRRFGLVVAQTQSKSHSP